MTASTGRRPAAVAGTHGRRPYTWREASWKRLSLLSRWLRSLPAQPSLRLAPPLTVRPVAATAGDRAPPAMVPVH